VSGAVNAGESVQQYDVIIVGAGFSGIANVHRLRKDGLKVHVFESGTCLSRIDASSTAAFFQHELS
jgi:ribulose 1,5-bisphosphate synthetase/thiazole synthase